MEDELNEVQLNVDELCRVCLMQEANITTLYCKCIVDGKIMNFPEVFQYVINFEINENDGFPKNICMECKRKTIQSYILKKKCTNSHELWQKLLKIRRENTKSNYDVSELTDYSYQLSNENIDAVNNSDILENGVSSGQRESNIKPDPGYDGELQEEEYVDYAFDADIIYTSTNNNVDEMSVVTSPRSDSENHVVINTVSDNDFEQYKFIQVAEEETPPKDEDIFDGKFNCRECLTEFANLRYLEEHRVVHKHVEREVFNSLPFYCCSRCRSVFMDAEKWNNHLEYLSDCEQNFSRLDEQCLDYQIPDQFENSDIKNVSIRLYFGENSGNNTLLCSLCQNFETDFSDNLLDHIKRIHFDKKTFSESSNTSQYLLTKGPYQCSICNLVFSNAYEAAFHIFLHSANFYCPLKPCKLQKIINGYNKYVDLIHHVASDHKKEELGEQMLNSRINSKQSKMAKIKTALSCDQCGKIFNQKSDLNVHIRLHTGERPYKCELCDRTFRTTGHRNDHMSTHSNEKLFECHICNQKFKSRRILNNHLPLHKGIRNFSCPICNKKFVRKHHVALHQKVHTQNINS